MIQAPKKRISQVKINCFISLESLVFKNSNLSSLSFLLISVWWKVPQLVLNFHYHMIIFIIFPFRRLILVVSSFNRTMLICNIGWLFVSLTSYWCLSLSASIYSSSNLFLKWLHINFNRLYLFNNVFSCSQYCVSKYMKFLRAIILLYKKWDGVIASSLVLSDKFVNGLLFKVCSISINKVVDFVAI